MGGWPTVAALFLLGWCATRRPGEKAALRHRHLLFPSNRGDMFHNILVTTAHPKSQMMQAKQQVAGVDGPVAVNLIRALFEAEDPEQALWPGSTNTLRNRLWKLVKQRSLEDVLSPCLTPWRRCHCVLRCHGGPRLGLLQRTLAKRPHPSGVCSGGRSPSSLGHSQAAML